MGEVGEPSRKDSFLHRTGSSSQKKQKEFIIDDSAYHRRTKIWALKVAGFTACVILCSVLLAIFLADHLGKGGKSSHHQDPTPAPPPKKVTTTPAPAPTPAPPPSPPTAATFAHHAPPPTPRRSGGSDPLVNVDESLGLPRNIATQRPGHMYIPNSYKSEPQKCGGEMRPKSGGYDGTVDMQLHRQSGQTTCRTRECHEIGNALKRSMNLNMDPCTNFYEFACGRTPNVGKTEGQFEYARSKQIQMELEILRAPLRPREPKAKALNFAKTLYSKCLESGTADEMLTQFSKIRDIPSTVLSVNWPVLGATHSHDMSKVAGDLLRKLVSIPALMGVKYEILGNDSKLWGWRIDPPTFLLTNPVLRSNLPAYTSFVAKIAKEFSNDSTATRGHFLPVASDIVDFELKLVQVLSSAENSAHHNSATANVSLPLGQLERLLHGNPSAHFSIKTFLKYLFSPEGNADVREDEVITVFNMDYIKSLTKVLTETPSRTVINYLGYRLVMILVPLATKTRSLLSNSERTFLPVLEAYTPFPTTVPGCYQLVSNYFGWDIRRHYFNNNFGSDTAQEIQTIMNKIKTELRGQIESNGCFSHERLVEASRDVGRIEPCHNYMSSDVEVEKYYEELAGKSDSSNYVEEIFKVFELTNIAVMSFLRGNITTFPYCASVPEGQMTIFYSREDKKISVPLAYWREPFYYKNNLQALNYGGIGAVIGHEFMHGLLEIAPEWTDHQDPSRIVHTPPPYRSYQFQQPQSSHDQQAKKQKTFLPSECVIEQYARFSTTSRGSAILAVTNGNGVTNSTRTFPEDFSDIGGVKLAFSAYKKSLNENNQWNNEQRLPGLETYSPEQLFFLKFANIWCDKSSDFQKDASTPQDLKPLPLPPHSPGEFRVWGTLQNNEDFARVWNCPVGSEMNPGPAKRCSVFE